MQLLEKLQSFRHVSFCFPLVHQPCGFQRQAVKLVLVAPPVELRWSAASVRKALLAGATVQREVQVGQSEALQRCPQQETRRSVRIVGLYM